MKYKPECSFTLPEAELESELNLARKMGKVRLGDQVLFFTRLAGGSYISYSEIAHAYLRQEEVNAKMCCGRANFDQFFLMLMGSDGKLRKFQVPDMASGQLALDHIAQKNPDCLIGYRKPATV